MKTGVGWLPRSRLDPLTVRTPILHVFEDRDSFMTPDFALLFGCKRSDRILMRVADMSHFEFITFGMAAAVLPGFDAVGARRGLARKVEAVFVYARAFLDAELRGDAVARRFLDLAPVENGLPDGLLTVIRMPPGR